MKYLLLSLLLVFPVGAWADPAHCKALARATPEQIMDFKRGEVNNLEVDHPGLGYGVGYLKPGTLFVVYFFDGGHDELNEGVEAAYFERAVQEMIDYSNSEGFPLGEISVYDTRSVYEFVIFTAESTDSRDVYQVLGMGRSGDCLVKVRMTTLLPEMSGREMFWTFVISLGLKRGDAESAQP